MHPQIDMRVQRARFPGGRIRAPGDKSVSQRVAMLAGLSSGISEVQGFLRSEDCLNTLGAVVQLGAEARWEGETLFITGFGGQPTTPDRPLDLGNSGTGIRLLTGLISGLPVEAVLTGDAYLQKRPMERVAIPLRQMGAEVTCLGEGGCPPIHIRGGGLNGIRYELPMASAQVKSAILLAGLHADGLVEVIEPAPTRDYTEKMFQTLGLPVTIDGLHIRMKGPGPAGPQFTARPWVVPGDFSSAAFWIAAGSLLPGTEVIIEDVGLNPRRTALLDVLRRMGADITTDAREVDGESIGTVVVRGTRLQGTRLLPEEIPNLIDEIPLLAVVASFAEGRTEIREAGELRVKESDRIRTTVTNLGLLGVKVTEYPDGLAVEGPCDPVSGAVLDSFGDHRIAMGMAVFSLVADISATIRDTGCIQTSYPNFWEHFQSLGGDHEPI